MSETEQTAPVPKPWIEAIHAYVPGKAKASDGRALVKLSANENPLGCGAAAAEALAKPRTPARYPDPGAVGLREAIGALHGIDAARIVCGTGSDELLNLAAQAYAGPGDEVLFSRHTFSVYDIAARRCGAQPVEAPDSDYGADVDALRAAVTERTRVVYLANPNNPTGSNLPHSEVARLLDGLPADVLFVLDQAYAEYTDAASAEAGLALASERQNVLVTRTFSKIYGLAGERIGWATGAPDLVANLNRIRGPFNVTTSGQAAAVAALGDHGFVRRSAEHNAQERARFVDAIGALGNYGLRALPSEANFTMVLFEGAVSAEAAHDALAEAGYAVRHFPGGDLSHALRITIGSAKQMGEIAATLRELVERDQ
ncbi:histidinol-phosphate transaminase [Qipengyuania atrilutea]|uniref:Histidinol-phosphate aminotransferase n=1 Tax=Qipengyuania atrilutea TaxID=2744473 RepID=A0A850HFE7_9SPHN|nr:histidinol-phosphate transaminase [Actirhodobacter atriluteus]NVD46079.1 histidinol-phosphate transaminase [Actirhodobacter atriluteus]